VAKFADCYRTDHPFHAFLFANVRMIIISLIPNVLALMITAGLMDISTFPSSPVQH